MNISEHLKKYRQKTGISQQSLADTLGCTQALVSLIETGSREPSEAFLSALFRADIINESQLVEMLNNA